MRKKISGSIQAKTFLSMLALLVVCCILIYGMVMIFFAEKLSYGTAKARSLLIFMTWWRFWSGTAWEASSDSLMQFSLTNNASVEVNDNYGE